MYLPMQKVIVVRPAVDPQEANVSNDQPNVDAFQQGNYTTTNINM